MILTAASFDILRANLFGGRLAQAQVDALNRIVAYCEDYGLTYSETAYVLATVFHETGILIVNPLSGRRTIYRSMSPVVERGSQRYLRSKRYYPFIGRGLVQLTWESNYARIGGYIGVDLVNNPELALDWDISLKILVTGMDKGWFTGVGFSKGRKVTYYNKRRYIRARAIINGKDKARLIAGYAIKFEKALRS